MQPYSIQLSPPHQFPPQKQHYYYHDYTNDSEGEIEDELFEAVPAFQFSSLMNADPSFCSSSLPSDASYMSLSSVGRSNDSTSSLTRRASLPASYFTINSTATKKRSCECKALEVRKITYSLVVTYPSKFLKYGVYLKLQTHETIMRVYWMSSILPISWNGHTKYSFTCSLLLPDIGLYENDQPCSFQITKRYSEFRAFYLDLVYSSHT
jgi:hypothetical protein